MKSSSRFGSVIAILNTLLTGGVLAVLLLRPPGHGGGAAKGGEGEAKEEAHGKGPGASLVGPTLKMADFVVHLRNPEAERFARLPIELELASEPDHERLSPYLPRLRDAFVAYLSDRAAEELAGSEALAEAKSALLRQAEEPVPGKHVRALYFTDFVVQ